MDKQWESDCGNAVTESDLGDLMQDLLWIAVTIAFFAVGIAYVHFCERVK